MDIESWLPITEYSGKYRVSVSTLRRRIKSGEIEYSFKEGKYLLRDSPQVVKEQPLPNASVESVQAAPPPSVSFDTDSEGSPILATANRLLAEIKKAYSQILQEKEEQIMLLKEEVTDLRTLAKVLETENERLRQLTSTTWIE